MKILVLAAINAVFLAQAVADDWPQWRGVNRDGVWLETGIVEKFDELSIRWRAEISAGYSGPTVADGRVYVTDRITKPQQMERVHCLTGKPETRFGLTLTSANTETSVTPRDRAPT